MYGHLRICLPPSNKMNGRNYPPLFQLPNPLQRKQKIRKLRNQRRQRRRNGRRWILTQQIFNTTRLKVGEDVVLNSIDLVVVVLGIQFLEERMDRATKNDHHGVIMRILVQDNRFLLT